MIRREVVEEVLSRTDIETLVSGYVAIRRAGTNLKGLCPFHSEKSPSFTIFPSDNSFYCFGCGVGGNAITFVRQIEHMDFPDAVRFLAKRAGITVVDDEDVGVRSNTPKIDKSRLLAMNVEAAKFFHANLMSDTPGARAALSYFRDKRSLSMATIKHFGLGYASDRYDEFTSYMLAKGYRHDELVTGNLVRRSDSGKYYDAFRNRVMFPIIDVSGDVIAFGGRVMDDSKPKYLNSSDTPVFKKLRNLFALNFARQFCAETLILCEGYMDVIALHAAGFTNAVATLGTAITSDQARLMSRYTKKVIISYDADEAGQKAATRAIGMLDEVGLSVTVLKIPGAKDPDEYIKQYGADKFRSLLDGSKSKFEFNMDKVLAKYDVSQPQDRIHALQDLTELIARFHSSAERDVYIWAVSKKLQVEADSLRHDVDRRIYVNKQNRQKQEGQYARQTAAGYGDKINPDYAKAPTVAKNEENILGLLFLYPQHRKQVFEGNMLCEEDFFTEFNRRVFVYLKGCYLDRQDPTVGVDDAFSPEEVGRITRMKLSRMQLTDNGNTVLHDMVRCLKHSMEMRASQDTKTYDELNRLLSSIRTKSQNENS